MDVLSETLDRMQFLGVVPAVYDARGAWGVRITPPSPDPAQHPIPPELRPFFHASFPRGAPLYVVIEGQVRVEVGGRAHHLEAGDALLLHHHLPHALRDAPATPLRPIADLLPPGPALPRVLNVGTGDGPRARVLAAVLLFRGTMAGPFLDSLPPALHLHRSAGETEPWLGHLVEPILREVSSPGPGTIYVISRLLNAAFAQLVRHHLATDAAHASLPLSEKDGVRGPTSGNGAAAHDLIGRDNATPNASAPPRDANWLRACLDESIGPALSLIHTRPAEPWTVDGLAQQVGMSRSVFAQRFAALVGTPPLAYLTTVRLQQASESLIGSELAVKVISRKVGYESEAAFSTAFRRRYQVAPVEYRKRHRQLMGLARRRFAENGAR
jgi:AraC-like DNA-binding protein